jgi:imidazole glycerol phosphate synthase subunit HisF
MKIDFKKLISMDAIREYVRKEADEFGLCDETPIEDKDAIIHSAINKLLEDVRLELVMNDGVYKKAWGVLG